MLMLEIRDEDAVVLGRMTVNDGGEAQVEGQVPVELPTLVPGRGRVTCEADPEAWARNLHRTLRTPYLRAVIVADAGPSIDDDQELTRAEAAQMVGVTPSAWSSYVSRGYAPAAISGPPATRWRAGDVRTYAQKRTARGSSGDVPVTADVASLLRAGRRG